MRSGECGLHDVAAQCLTYDDVSGLATGTSTPDIRTIDASPRRSGKQGPCRGETPKNHGGRGRVRARMHRGRPERYTGP